MVAVYRDRTPVNPVPKGGTGAFILQSSRQLGRLMNYYAIINITKQCSIMGERCHMDIAIQQLKPFHDSGLSFLWAISSSTDEPLGTRRK